MSLNRSIAPTSTKR